MKRTHPARIWALILILIFPAAGFAEGADASFEAVCALLSQAAGQQDLVYRTLEAGFDAADAVESGALSAEEGLAALRAAQEQLLSIGEIEIAPTDEVRAYMLERGISLSDFQAVVDGAILDGSVQADTLQPFIALLEQDPDTAAIDTSGARAEMLLEEKMNFIALNTVILPATDAEADAIARLVVAPTGYLTDAGLAWESDLDVLMAKYAALEDAYEELIAQKQLDIDAIEAELDAAGQSETN